MNKIKVGFFAFSEITEPGAHASYNLWHSTDHMPENLALPGIAYAQRWVAPPEYVKARLFAHPSVAPAQYLTCYYMTEPVEETVKEFLGLGARMTALGRMHPHRKSYIGGPFVLIKGYVAQRIEVAPEALPYRAHKGLLVTLADLVDPSQHDAVAQWYDRVHLPDMMTVKGVTGVYWFVSGGGTPGGSFTQTNPPGRFIHVYYLDEDPLETLADLKVQSPRWRSAGRSMDFSKSVKPLLVGPFKTTVPFQYD